MSMKCLAPIAIENPNRVLRNQEKFMQVDCGKCSNCKKKRAAQWTFRLLQEEKLYPYVSSYFVTLTYDENQVPRSPSGRLTLNGKHPTLFFKRLRKRQPREQGKIRYYLVGEYGSHTERPHYHAIIFGCKNEEIIHKSWTYGNVMVGTVTGESIAYTTNYVDKDLIIPKYEGDDRIREFSRMSHNIGVNFLSSEMCSYYKDDLSRQYVKTKGNFKIPLPRYYKEKLFSKREKIEARKIAREASDDNIWLSDREYHEFREGRIRAYKNQYKAGKPEQQRLDL